MKGAANQVAGKVKQGLGKATNDGRGQDAGGKGNLQKAVGKAKDTVKKAADI